MEHIFVDRMSEEGLTIENVPGFQHRHHKHPSDSHIYFYIFWPCIMQWFLVNDQRDAQIPFYEFIFYL